MTVATNYVILIIYIDSIRSRLSYSVDSIRFYSPIGTYMISTLFDDFISDILLPCTKKVMPSQELFDLYVKYCAYHDIPSETSPITFGRTISKRLHSTRRNGRTFYYCEVNPKRLK